MNSNFHTSATGTLMVSILIKHIKTPIELYAAVSSRTYLALNTLLSNEGLQSSRLRVLWVPKIQDLYSEGKETNYEYVLNKAALLYRLQELRSLEL